MKLVLPLGAALVLVLTACGAGHKPAPQATNAAAHHRDPSVKAVAAARERVALRKAERLLRRVVLPPGATRLVGAPAGEQYLSYSGLGTSVVTMTADRSSFWRIRGSMASVTAFERMHPVAGLKPDGDSTALGRFETTDFDGGGIRNRRSVSVTAVPADGSTLVRIDAGVAWLYPRSPSEVVPGGVRKIDIRDRVVHVRVTEALKVARIVRWFDGLGVSPHGAVVSCKILIIASRATLVFRSSSGAELARAVVPSRPADGCYPIEFGIGGTPQAPLVDTTGPRRAFVARLERLLGLRLPNR